MLPHHIDPDDSTAADGARDLADEEAGKAVQRLEALASDRRPFRRLLTSAEIEVTSLHGETDEDDGSQVWLGTARVTVAFDVRFQVGADELLYEIEDRLRQIGESP